MPGWVAGSDSAPVEVEEYADFQCPACKQFAVMTLTDVMDRLVRTGQVRWRFRDFPIVSLHPNAMAAHEAAACAGEQGKFWEIHDQLYYNQPQWEFSRNAPRQFRGFAERVGVDLRKYDECLSTHRYAGRIQASVQQGQARGVSSTPTLIVGGMLITGAVAYDSMKVLIQKASSSKKQ